MKGKIRTKERCNCGGKFVDFGQVMACGECLKQGKISIPTRYYLDLFWNGKQRKIYSDNDGRVLNNFELARRVLTEIRQLIDKHRFDPADYVAKSYVALQFNSYAKKWIQKYKELSNRKEVAPRTVEIIKSLTEKHYIPYFKTTDIRDIRTGDIEDFYLSLSKDLTLSSQKNIMAVLQMLFSNAKRRHDIREIPNFPKIELNEPETIWIDEKTQNEVYIHIPDKHKPIFFFMFRQGVRPGESRAVHWSDIDWNNRTVTIRRTFSGSVLRETTKTGKIRVLPLDSDVYDSS